MHKLEDLKVWHKAIELSTEIYRIVAKFPSDEKYGLSSQIKRSAVSIASNIAEGAGRNSEKEFVQFLGIANGSCYELLTQILIAGKLNLIDNEKLNDLCQKIIEIQKMVFGLRKRLLKEINK